MAETVEKILLFVEANTDAVQKGLAESTQAVKQFTDEQKRLKAELKELEAAGEKNTDAYRATQRALQETTTWLQTAKKEQASYQLEATKATQANISEEGSLRQKRAALSAASAAYDRASADMKKFDAATIELGQNVTALRQELIDEERAMALAFRNVGNYPDSVNALNTGFQSLQSTLEKYPKTLEGMSEALAEMKQQLRAEEIGSAKFDELSEAISKTETKIQTLTGKADEFGNRISKNRTKETINDIKDSVTGAVAAFQLWNLVQGSGAEKSKAMETAVRATALIQATQATLIGIEAAIGAVTNGVKSIRIALLATEAAQTRGLTVATFAQAAAQAVLNAVMAANPVMLIVAGIGALIAAFAFFTRGTDEATKSQMKMSDALKKQGEEQQHALEVAQTSQQNRIALMQAENKSAVEINKQQLDDLAANYKAKDAIMKTNMERAKVLATLAAKTSSEDKKKEYQDEINGLRETNKKIQDEQRAYWDERRVLEAQGAKAVADAAKQSNDLRIAAIKNDRQRAREEIKADLEQSLKDAKSEDDKANIQQAARNKLAALQAQWGKEDLDKARARLEEKNKAEILLTQAGGAARFAAEQAAIIKLRDFDLAAAGNNATKKTIINREAELAIEKLNQDALKARQAIANQEIDLEQRKQQAIAQAEMTNAVTAEEKMVARLNLVNVEYQAAAAASKRKADEAKANAQVEIADATERARIINEINETQAQEQIALLAKTTQQTAEVTKQYDAQKLQREMDMNQTAIDLETENGDRRLQLQLAQLDMAQEKELQNTELTEKEKQLIREKYDKQRETLQATARDQALSATKKTLGDTAALFGKQTAAYKVLASASALIDTYQSAIAAYKGTVGIPVVGTTLAPIAAATAVATGLATVAKINSVQLYDGGYTGNGDPKQESREAGWRPYTYHKGEYIVPNWLLTTRTGTALVGNLEAMRQNKSRYSSGGFYDGGSTNGNIAYQISADIGDQSAFVSRLESAITRMPNPVVFVEDINSGQSTVAKVQSRANV